VAYGFGTTPWGPDACRRSAVGTGDDPSLLHGVPVRGSRSLAGRSGGGLGGGRAVVYGARTAPVVPGRSGVDRAVRAGNQASLLLGALPDPREALALDHAEC
jgi:hypothetical protein